LLQERKKPAKLDAAKVFIESAIATFEELEKLEADEPRYQHLRFLSTANRGLILSKLGEDREAIESLTSLLPEYRALVERYSGVREYRQGLVIALLNLGEAFESQKEHSEAAKAFDEARLLLKRLREKNSDAHNYHAKLIEVTRKVAAIQDKLGERQQAIDLRNEANRLQLEGPPK